MVSWTFIEPSVYLGIKVWHVSLATMMVALTARGGGGNSVVILVRVCEPVF